MTAKEFIELMDLPLYKKFYTEFMSPWRTNKNRNFAPEHFDRRFKEEMKSPLIRKNERHLPPNRSM